MNLKDIKLPWYSKCREKNPGGQGNPNRNERSKIEKTNLNPDRRKTQVANTMSEVKHKTLNTAIGIELVLKRISIRYSKPAMNSVNHQKLTAP
ncbi:18530_t:CDS:2, partial [Gigaspora rosea]